MFKAFSKLEQLQKAPRRGELATAELAAGIKSISRSQKVQSLRLPQAATPSVRKQEKLDSVRLAPLADAIPTSDDRPTTDLRLEVRRMFSREHDVRQRQGQGQGQ